MIENGIKSFGGNFGLGSDIGKDKWYVMCTCHVFQPDLVLL